ncbi:MAG TPA: Gfo/Idh/MocA family oxidoreductase [Verrucomicrobiota bacterium]|nr:Gfo/Idh/MocA family oxidoreductase [Verrucomicrobiota bacterium]HNT15857.1 Gfo/Idh/MocA family oxidoreductase [Verrucomicrobiota bacterium]
MNDQPARAFCRRKFLRRGALALAAASVPAIIPATARGRGGARAPSERIGMGFIGLGGQGTGHLLGGAWTYVAGGYVSRGDVQVLAVCDVRAERREAAQHRCNAFYAGKFNRPDYDGVRAYADFLEVLARPDIDAVLLALPYHWAAPMALLAAQAGKDVYCEKPVAITIDLAQRLVANCRRFGVIYQAGTQQRSEYEGRFRLACELVRNGRIGRLREVYAYRQPGAFFPTQWTTAQRVPVPAGFDWDRWLGPLPWRPFGGEAGHALPGWYVGDLNWSPHHYDLVQWVVNPDPLAPVTVEFVPGGAASPVVAAPPAGAAGRPEEGQVRYHYANGVVVHSTEYPGEPVGSVGGACFVGTEGRLAVDRVRLVAYPERILKEPLRPAEARVEQNQGHSDNFLECVRSRRAPVCNPTVAAQSMTAILTGGMALALQRTVKWDPRRGEFSGDAVANRLLAYSPRPPWRF